MNIGTYKQCSNCKLKDNCCNSFKDTIDNVMLHEKEYFNIIKKINIKEPEKYFSKIDNEIYNIKTNKNGVCIFYKEGKCQIYENRPNDCKLYPFDIIRKDGDYYLILYKLKCINENKFVEESIRIEEIINDMIPWIDKYTDENNYPKLKQKIDNEDYIVIGKIEFKQNEYGLSDFMKFAYKCNKVRDVREAFEENPVEEEWHKGKIEKVVSE